MSLITINLAISGDTATSVSLLTLTNAATGADVSGAAGVTLPAAFTDAGGGAWTRTFTDTGIPLYAYTYRLTWSDGSTNDEAGTIAGLTLAAGYYASQADVAKEVGTPNLAIWTDQDPTGTPDVTRIQAALDYADDAINSAFRNGEYVVPLTPVSSVMTRWAISIAIERLYHNRGQRDDDKDGNKYDLMVAKAMREMGQFKAGHKSLAATRENSCPTGPIDVVV